MIFNQAAAFLIMNPNNLKVKFPMMQFRILRLSLIAAFVVSGCSIFRPGGISLPNNPVEATSSSPMPAPTCLPQPSGPCLTLGPDEPVQIRGDIPFTSPFFLNTISQPFVMLEDQAGFIRRDREFRFPLAGQVIGPVVVSEDEKLSYTLPLPSVPQGTSIDVDNDSASDLGVQTFQVAYWSNTWGDPFLEERDGKGWSTAYNSAITDPENDDEIVGGILVVWSPDENQGFPGGFGPDRKLFTSDDPIETIPAGYTLVDLNEEPFRFYKERYPGLTLLEGAGAVKDYSGLDYGESFQTLFAKVSREYPFTEQKKIDWDALQDEYFPRFDDLSSDQEFYKTLFDFTLQIPDGHVGVSMDQEIFFSRYGGGFGMVLDRLTDGKVIVKEILPGLPADKAGIQQGAEVLTWDGEPVAQAIEKVVPGFGPYSTDHARKLGQVAFLTRTPPDTKVEIEYRNPGGAQPESEALKAAAEFDSLLLSIPGYNLDEVQLPLDGLVLDESGLGYIRIDTFSDDYALMASVWDRYIQNLIDNEVPGLIIDLRANPGGSLGLAMDFAGYFFDQEIELYENYYYSDATGRF